MSESESVVMRLFKFSNINASSIRTIMVADCLDGLEGKVSVEKETEPENNQSTSQVDAKPPVVGQELATQNEANKSDKDSDEKMPDQMQKKKSLSKVQSIQVYENGCLCTKFVELDEEDLNDKLNGTIEYSHDYRMAEGPSCMEDGKDSNLDNDSGSSRASSELNLTTSCSSLKEIDGSSGVQASGPNLENIQENFMLGDLSVTSQEESRARQNEYLTVTEVTAQNSIASDGDLHTPSYEISSEQNEHVMDTVNFKEQVDAQFSFQVNVENSNDILQEDILNPEENVSYHVNFDLLESDSSLETERAKKDNNLSVSDAMDATTSVSNKRILHGQQQLQGSKFRDPSTSDIENDFLKSESESSNSSQSLSVPGDSALCTEQASFCCVDYKKLRKSTKPNDFSENQIIPMKFEEIPAMPVQGDSEMPGPSASQAVTNLLNQEKRKGSKKHKLKKVLSEESSKACASDESQTIVLSTKPQTLSSPQSEDKYLIFTKGSETYTPHQIGIKRIKPLKAFNDSGQLLPNVDENTHGLERGEDHYDEVDHLIDMDGHIIGMCLSPDQRYGYYIYTFFQCPQKRDKLGH